MRDLLYKEFKIGMNPMLYFFMAFVLMLLIPNYMYLIPCFFICNAIFYSFQQSVLNNDPSFTLLLPVSKREAVKAKVIFVVIIQFAMLLLYIPMIVLNNAVIGVPNKMLDACPALLGGALTVFAAFNITFLPSFYKTCTKAGRSFLYAAIVMILWIFVFEGFFIVSDLLRSMVPFFDWVETHIDCVPASSGAWTAQLAFIAVCAVIYALITLAAYRKSARNFEKVDL